MYLLSGISRVSSVLNKDNKNYGKKNLIDGSEETCWNSEAVRSDFSMMFFFGIIDIGFTTMDTDYTGNEY
jgi:hypothetical protein